MCGIAGMIGASDRGLAAAMIATLAHRGPDGDGLHVDDEVALAHRRLAIIDLSPGGAQPMLSADRELVIVFNGEIYNYQALARELRGLGRALVGDGDTAVILAAYDQWGAAAIDRLEGMFALVIWDRRRRQALIARDRVGQKPLYYALVPRPGGGEALYFGSEPKALLAVPAVDRRLDPAALDEYLGLFYVPPPRSIFRGIRQLPPGHRMTWREGQVTISRYWDAEPAPEAGRSHAEWAEEIAPILDAAIRSTMVADVPVGAFLSGGLDSSTIVAVMAAASRRPIITACVGYGPEGAGFDERAAARAVAQHFATDHHELVLGPAILGDLDAVVAGFDEPFGSWTALLAWHLSRFTSQRVKVAVAGDGGDELFGGYPRYRGMLLSGLAARAPRRAQALARRALASPLVARESTDPRSYVRWARAFLGGLALAPGARYAGFVGYWSPDERDRLLTPALREAIGSRRDFVAEAFDRPVRGDMVDRAGYADLHGFLAENVLRGSDRMSMAHGLEVRVPFCDHRLVEALARVPSRHKVGPLAQKRLLKTIVRGRLPPAIAARPKLGFNGPFAAWLGASAAQIRAEWLSSATIAGRGLLEPAAVDALWREHQSGARDHGARLWALIVLEAWLRRHGASL